MNDKTQLSFLSRLNPFRRIGVEEDAQNRMQAAATTIRQCEATIYHASYLMRLAEAEQAAVSHWLNKESSE